MNFCPIVAQVRVQAVLRSVLLDRYTVLVLYCKSEFAYCVIAYILTISVRTGTVFHKKLIQTPGVLSMSYREPSTVY